MALALLARREHSAHELARKLRQRGCAPAEIDQALARLQADGALSDTRMAAQYATERIAKGFGPLRIRAELRERGISAAVVEQTLAPFANDWPAQLAQLHRHRFGADAPRDAAECAKRARFLARRGFASESIRRILNWSD